MVAKLQGWKLRRTGGKRKLHGGRVLAGVPYLLKPNPTPSCPRGFALAGMLWAGNADC